jgi:4-hydroxybenzoate polyprenyltransferase
MWAGMAAGAGIIFQAAMILPALIMAWQLLSLKPENDANILFRFQSNHWVGLALTLAFWLEYKF